MDTTSRSPVALVTGASSGVGLALTSRLLAERWSVVTLTRSPLPQHDPALAAARAEGRLRAHHADLADLRGLARALEGIAAAEPRIDLLVNNAGVSLDAPRAAASGRDVHFDVNVLAPYVIARALAPNVAKGEHRTILNVSSNALLQVKELDLDELMRPTRFTKLFGSYAASKLALSLWTHEMAALLPGGVEMRSVCPGANDTPMTRGAGMPGWLRVLVPILFRDPKHGAARVLDAARGGLPRGAFLHRGRPAAIPHLHRAREVHDLVASLAG
ncbi:SDR family NAD(P)-dependent oxidoreductase [Sandaracinus amylolyticus]|uniref:Putative oxidoreductase n=1 Tax=Sandaracinus amylolyticus TaxID=927083 RepID=A0A0F6YGF4_9BACT|nr:SDR family NAD(P)-dependent oxidoreductase [Sandaracinus amylolyticus]AKF04616.1 Putative oxidoreductase [Sandaracinus amylolyticus]